MRVSYYYFLAGVRPASHPLTVSIFAFIIRSIWAIGHVLEIHLHFVVNNCEFFIIHNNSKNILTGFPVFKNIPRKDIAHHSQIFIVSLYLSLCFKSDSSLVIGNYHLLLFCTHHSKIILQESTKTINILRV